MSFPKYTHHICFVSKQTLPNYLGATLTGTEPDKVHMIVTYDMQRPAQILKKALQCYPKQFAIEQHMLKDESIPDNISNLLDTIFAQCGDESVAVNITGGTKIMAITAYIWASRQDKPPFLFYIDTDNNKILQINEEQEIFALTKKLGVREHLEANTGYTVSTLDNNPPVPSETSPEERMLKNFVDYQNQFMKNAALGALGMFNKLAKQAKDTLKTEIGTTGYKRKNAFEQKKSQILQNALQIAADAGKLRIVNQTITYTSEDARFWCNGGWLEQFVKAKLFQMKRLDLIDDWAANVTIQRENKIIGSFTDLKKPKDEKIALNELDGAFISKNRFYVIECKAKNMKPDKQDKEKLSGFSEAIYKLNTLKESLGGALSKGMIVSVYPPAPNDEQRCKDLQLTYCYGKDILQLEKKLQEWINPSKK